jgi:TPP-dependent indolepyruvate ferredoxin oxidoreductase alpha subunit
VVQGAARRVTLLIDEARCPVCGPCLAKAACRGSAIRIIDKGDAPFVDMARCWGCLACIPACPFEAVIRRGEL